jgi:hypothetical protein
MHFNYLNMTVVWFQNQNCQEMALKSVNRLILSIDGADCSIGFVSVQTPF